MTVSSKKKEARAKDKNERAKRWYEEEKIKNGGVKLKCSVCKKTKAVTTGFFKTMNPRYADTGYYDVCRDCVKEIIVDASGRVEPHKFKGDVCEPLDIPFVESEFDRLSSDPNVQASNFIGTYLKVVARRTEYRDKKYSDSEEINMFDLDESKQTTASTDKNIPKDKKQIVTQEMVDFWGKGFTSDYYLEVQKLYDNFMKYEDESKLDYKKQSDYKTLCQLERKKTEMLQNADVKANELKAVIDSISKLSEDLNIKALQRKNDESDNLNHIVGVVTRYVEDVMRMPIPDWDNSDWLGDMPYEDFLTEMAYFKGPLFDEFDKPNPYKELIDTDKKKYTPNDSELEIEKFEDYEPVSVEQDDSHA